MNPQVAWANLARQVTSIFILIRPLIFITALWRCRQRYNLPLYLAFYAAGNSQNPLFDNAEFQSSYVQRVFQYLKLWESGGDSLDNFWFLPSQVMGDHAECIETLTR